MTTVKEIDLIIACDEFRQVAAINAAQAVMLDGELHHESVILVLPGGPAAIRKIANEGGRLESHASERRGIGPQYESLIHMRERHGTRVKVKRLLLCWCRDCQHDDISGDFSQVDLLAHAEASNERVLRNLRMVLKSADLPALGQVKTEVKVYP